MSTEDSHVSEMFDAESKRLLEIITDVGETMAAADTEPWLSISEIVKVYHQVINVASIASVLRQQIDTENHTLLSRIAMTEAMITERFDSGIHPKIMRNLAESIRIDMDRLESRESDRSSKEWDRDDRNDPTSSNNTQDMADDYEELRKKMSVEEFVKQYETRLHA